MKKRFEVITAFVLLFSAIVVTSCSSDDTSVSPDPNPRPEEISVPSTVEFNNLRKQVLEGEKQQINALLNEERGFSFTSKKGVKVEVSYLYINDKEIKEGDEVTCTFIELYDKGVMALANRPTMGIYPERNEGGGFEYEKDDYGRLKVEGYRGFIITGGEFYFDIKVNG
ncbi:MULTISPECIES: hypothetical protein [unclassified Myroides]|uniref:hypothetical protein n=1 Tax=unclassified Myroides TaxID=2642485 RepID=UPI003D2F6C03